MHWTVTGAHSCCLVLWLLVSGRAELAQWYGWLAAASFGYLWLVVCLLRVGWRGYAIEQSPWHCTLVLFH